MRADIDDEDFVLDDYPLYNLNRTAATYTDEMTKALMKVGMSQTLWRVLAILNDKNPSTVSDIARRSVIKNSTLTRMLGRMEGDGFVERVPWSEDKRIIHVSITESGVTALSQALEIADRVYERTFENVAEKDIQTLTQSLKTMRENLSRSPYVGGR